MNAGAADLRAVLSNDAVVDTEIVPDIAARHGAIAAINAGFFLLPSGDPSGIYKLQGQLVSDTRRPRGALGIARDASGLRLLFGRVAATMSLRVPRRARLDAVVEIAGVDTTRQRGRLMLFTPAYHQHTDTQRRASSGSCRGSRCASSAGRFRPGRRRFPATVTCCRSAAPGHRRRCNHCASAARVELDTNYTVVDGSEGEWEKADAIVGGAGLLLLDGRIITDWKVEQLAPTFAQTRHPRTLVGTHPDGSIWLVTVDGRQPKLSAGMSLSRAARAGRAARPEERAEPGRRRLHDDVGGRKNREQPVGRRGAKESQRRADRHAR